MTRILFSITLLVALVVFFQPVPSNTQDDCNGLCPAIWEPVCGSNGVTYGNQCKLNIAKCRNPSLSKAHDGPCDENNCNQLCTADWDPVCGSDGITYSNQCNLNIAKCRDPSLSKAHDGPCEMGQDNCNRACTEDWTPVCGSNGITYSNQCNMGVAICRDSSLYKEYDGICSDKGSCSYSQPSFLVLVVVATHLL